MILQGLAAQTVAIRLTNHTIQPMATVLKSLPIVRPIQFLKGLDLINVGQQTTVRNENPSLLQQPQNFLPTAALVARDPVPLK